MHSSWYRLALLALGLGLAACSQAPEDAQIPGVEVTPQFGSAFFDHSGGLTVNNNLDVVFVGGTKGTDRVITRRHNRNGSLSWERSVNVFEGLQIGLASTPGNTVVGVGSSEAESLIYKYSATGQKLWQANVQPPQGSSTTAPYARLGGSDAQGNTYVLADTFDDTNFIAKFDPQGKQIFAKPFTYGKFQVATDGSIYSIETSVDAVALTKYSPQVSLLWSKVVARGRWYVSALVIGADALYLAGEKRYGTDGATSETDAMIAKVDLKGTLKWLKTFGTRNYDAAYDVTLDAQGNIYVTGGTYGSLASTNKGEGDIFVRKYTSAAGIAWTKQYGTPQDDVGSEIETMSSSELYIAGSTDGDLGAGNQGGSDVYLMRLDSSGNKVWVR